MEGMTKTSLSLLLSLLLALPALGAELGKAPGLPELPQAAAAPSVQAAAGLAAPALDAAAGAAPAQAEAVSAPRSTLSQVQEIRLRLEAQLAQMEEHLGPDPLFEQVRRQGYAAIDVIEGHVAAGRIDPGAVQLRPHAEHPKMPVIGREARVGIYPVAADPFQWGHLLIGLNAIAELRLDKVYYMLAGDDPRKPNMTPADKRHPMGQAVLDVFAPLFAYSGISKGTNYDGETNTFKMLGLNYDQRVHAHYLVGGDHYKLKDAKGNDDTLPKLEKKLASADAGHNPDAHRISVAFIKRGEAGEPVPTSLDVHFLENIDFEASSTLVRNGRHALMPYAAYDWARRHLPGQYGIPPAEKAE